MNGYLTPKRFSKVLHIPVSLSQTELRRGKHFQVAQIPVNIGQQLHVRGLTVNVVKNLTPGAIPVYATTSLGTVNLGVYFGATLTSPLALAYVVNLGVSSTNPYAVCKLVSPGVYTFVVSNNTANMDFSVSASGCAKLYL
jgi:hypothetical protein